MNDDAEGPGRNLGVERAPVAGGDLIEYGRTVGDQPGEDIEPADRALRVGERRDAALQRDAFHQRDDVNAAPLQHGAGSQVDFMHAEGAEAILHRRVRPREEARPHPPGNPTETEIEAGRLDLVLADLDDARYLAAADHGADVLGWEDAGRPRRRSCALVAFAAEQAVRPPGS